MADCKKYIEMISSFADGELSGNDKIELEKHLEACASCRSLLALYRDIAQVAEESLVEPPDNLAHSIMEKINALPIKEAAVKSSAKKSKKPLKPVIISFLAAAACLALVFIVSPEFFGLKSSTTSTENASLASAAPSAAMYCAESAAQDSASDAEAKSSDTGGTKRDAEAGAGAAPEQQDMIAEAPALSSPPASITPTSSSPSPSPSPETPQYMIAGMDELKEYYAVFDIEGQLPGILKDYTQTANEDGSFNIEISLEVADQLIRDGYKVKMGAPDVQKALVKYTPPA